jgi:tRNA(Ile)-lysidine synthase
MRQAAKTTLFAGATPARQRKDRWRFFPVSLRQRLGALVPGFPDAALCVALSGGIDSIALLAALAAEPAAPTARPRKGRRSRGSAPRIRAVHVHHGLHPNADQWTAHCEHVAARLGVPLTVLRVKVTRPQGSSLEATAREARYEALAGVLQRGEALLTAHHEDDQLETVLLQLLRGAGVAGLAAMPEIAAFAEGWLVRPMLGCSRPEIESWVRAQGLTWVEDETNADERLDRNYLRRRVLPAIRARWPSAASAVSRSARHAAEARRLLDALALADTELAANGRELFVSRLRALDSDRRRNAVRFWIARSGFALPDTRRLEEIVGPLLEARSDANPQVSWNGVTVQRHADLLSLSRGSARDIAAHDEHEWNWQTRSTIALGEASGTLAIVPDRHGPLDLDALPETLVLRPRRGGERLRPSRGRPTRTLKALLQEARVPLAERERLPLVFAGDRLIAAGDRWIEASVQAEANTARRGRLVWSRASAAPGHEPTSLER